MTTDLTPSLRDADLIAQLEAARGKAGFEFIQRGLIHQQQQRDQRAAMTPAQRRRTAFREKLEATKLDAADLRHIHSVLAICGLPYTRQPIDVRRYERTQGRMKLVVTAGELDDPNGNTVPQPLPYGTRSRLLLVHLCSEAIRQKSPTIQIEDSLTAFIHALGFSVTGGKNGTLTAFKQQINALASCHMRIGVWDGTRSSSINTQPFQRLDVWLPPSPDQRMLWPSTVTFSTDFYETLKTHALPINVDAMRHFANSPRKLDLLFWLGYRLNSMRAPLHLSWDALKSQFGTGFALERQFKAKITEDVEHFRAVFPKLGIALNDSGMTIQPTGPEALAIPAKSPAKPRTLVTHKR